MGDTTVTQSTEAATEPQENAASDVTSPSVDNVKEVKPSQNISIDEPSRSPEAARNEEVVNEAPLVSIQAVFKTTTSTTSSVDNSPPITEKHVSSLSETFTKAQIAKSNEQRDENRIIANERNILRNKTDIFCLEKEDVASTIFSVGGAPSKVIHKPAEISGSEVASTDTLGSVSSHRNPVTGMGVNSNDEFRNKPSKRKDGNPVLGLGYKDEQQFGNTSSHQRIPPGGYSQGLW